MRRRRLSFLVALAAVVGMAASAGADEQVAVSAFQPTQVELGKEFALHSFVEGWKKEAKAAGKSLRAWAPELQARYARTRVPVVIAPDGAVRNVDMHHRLFALREVERLTGARFRLGIRVLQDYTGQTFDDYAHDFVEVRGLGWFGVDAKGSAATRMRSLPDSFDALRNNPLRAAVGEVMENVVGVDPDGMELYYEFRIAAMLRKQGVRVRAGAALTPAVLARVRQAIFRDPAVVAFVLASRRDPTAKRKVGAVVRREVAAATASATPLAGKRTAKAPRAHATRTTRPARRLGRVPRGRRAMK